MTNKELSLSDKIYKCVCENYPDVNLALDTKDIIQAIKLLKELIPDGSVGKWRIKNIIDKIFGDKLTK